MNETANTARQRAQESVSTRFSRIMNATTSRWGMLTDPAIVGVLMAPAIIALIAAFRLEASPPVRTALEVVVALPIVVALLVVAALRGARAGVVDWLAGLPFPVENLNALLNGLGDTLVVSFRGGLPEVPALNVELDRVSPECFVTKSSTDVSGAEGPWVDVRIGVTESKRNPSASNHARYVRVRALVDHVLVPLAERFPIAQVRVR